MICGEDGSESAIFKFAVSAPTSEGLKTTLTVQVLAAAKVLPQVVASTLKSAAFVPRIGKIAMPVMVAKVLLVSVMNIVGLVVVTATFPNASREGVTVNWFGGGGGGVEAPGPTAVHDPD